MHAYVNMCHAEQA